MYLSDELAGRVLCKQFRQGRTDAWVLLPILTNCASERPAKTANMPMNAESIPIRDTGLGDSSQANFTT